MSSVFGEFVLGYGRGFLLFSLYVLCAGRIESFAKDLHLHIDLPGKIWYNK